MRRYALLVSILTLFAYARTARADGVVVNTGLPDGLIATASRPSSAGKLEIETADDLSLPRPQRSPAGRLPA